MSAIMLSRPVFCFHSYECHRPKYMNADTYFIPYCFFYFNTSFTPFTNMDLL